MSLPNERGYNEDQLRDAYERGARDLINKAIVVYSKDVCLCQTSFEKNARYYANKLISIYLSEALNQLIDHDGH